MRSFLVASLLALALPLTGCDLYFGDPKPLPCDYGGSAGDRAAEYDPGLRNPTSGQCEYYGSTNPYPCGGECGPCTYPAGEAPTPDPGDHEEEPAPSESDLETGAQAPLPPWGYCESACTGLDELTCLATDDCRGIYTADPAGGTGVFMECWQTDRGTSLDPQSCEGLGAQQCSEADSCAAVHEYVCEDDGSDREEPGLIPSPCVAGTFLSCNDEPGSTNPDGCYGDQDCESGYSCNASEICLPPPGGPCPDGACDLPAVCYGYCVADVLDPGQCNGAVECRALPPTCEAGSTPGIKNGCWTGYCIPLSECPQVDCADVMSETTCVIQPACDPYYVGIDCSCDPTGCSCASWQFDSCQDTPTI